MLDVMQTIKEEVVNDDFMDSCKDFVSKVQTQSTVVFVCNTDKAVRHLITIAQQTMYSAGARRIVRGLAHQYDADAIISIITACNLAGESCMMLHVETLLESHAVVYPYERIRGRVVWKESRQVKLSSCYADLLPKPEGMAQA
jgi:hypothetical protein